VKDLLLVSSIAKPSPEVARTAIGAGRGLVLISAAKLWFMVAGYVIQFGLPRALGSPEKYGLWVLVLSLVSPLNNVMVTATIQGVSRFTSESAARGGAVVRAALRMQMLLGGGATLAFFLLAPAVAWFEHDAALTPYLRLAAGVVGAYAFYAVFVGAANGAHAFQKQAGLDMTFASLRALFVVGAAALTGSALAAVGGFVAAALLILLLSIAWVGLGPASTEKMPVAPLLRFFLGVAAYLLIVNLLMFVDGLLLKRLVAEAASRSGAADPSAVANLQEGLYGAVQAIARIPYQLILAVTFIIFPLVSQATFAGDVERTRRYVATTMRYSLLVVALFAVLLGARPGAVMHLFYRPEYAMGAAALPILLFGYVCFSLFTIAGTIVNGAGRTRPPLYIGLGTLAFAAFACWMSLSFALGSGRDPLFYVASATALSMALGLGLFGLYLHREFGAFIHPLSLARVVLSAAAALVMGSLWPRSGVLGGKIGTLLSCAVLALVFLGVAMVLGELRPREILRDRRG
jgi:stage V sporulation protein B